MKNIHAEFRSTFQSTPDFSIDFYKKNIIFFENIKALKDKEELKFYIEIIAKYVEANFDKDRYNLAISLIENHLSFIDKEVERLNASELKDDWYYSLFLLKAISFYHLKDYKNSTPIFEVLVKFDPQNDRYKNWLNVSQYEKRLWISQTIIVISGILIAIELLFEKFIPSFFARISLLMIGLLGVIFTTVYDYYVKRSFRKKKNE